MPGDASGPFKVLADIRDVLVEILGATHQQEKREGQEAHAEGGGPHDDFRRELAESVRDAIQSGMHAFMSHGAGVANQATPTLPSVPQAGLRPAPQTPVPTPTSERPQPAPQTPVPQRPEPLPQPATLPTVPATQRTAPQPQPTPQPTTPERQPFRPLDLGNPFKDRPERKGQSDGVTTPAVVPIVGAAPTANLLPTNVPAEMRTGANLPAAVPTTNTRPLGSLPTTLGGFSGLSGGHQQPLPTTPGLLGNFGQRQTGGGQVAGDGRDIAEAARKLSGTVGQLSGVVGRIEHGDETEQGENWQGRSMWSGTPGAVGGGLEVPAMAGPPSVGEGALGAIGAAGAAAVLGRNPGLARMAMLLRIFGS